MVGVERAVVGVECAVVVGVVPAALDEVVEGAVVDELDDELEVWFVVVDPALGGTVTGTVV